jgi:beta-mannanase
MGNWTGGLRAAAACALVIATSAVAAPAAGSAVATNGNLVPASGALFGAFVQQGTAATHYDAVLAFENKLGFKLTLDHHYRSWTNTFWKEEQQDIAAGRIPLISWTAQGTTAAAIASGSQDANITRVADAIKALGSPVLLRFAYEMDQPAGHPRYIGPPADFIAAWRHVYAIFQARGATNARFVWCAIAANFANGKAQSYYPGDAYVDWIGADGYNWYPGRKGSAWTGFGTIFTSFYTWAAPRGKPLIVAETGAMEDPASPSRKAAWIAAAAAWLKTHPAVKGVSYLSATSPAGYDFRAGTSATALAAFQAMGLDAYFNPLH